MKLTEKDLGKTITYRGDDYYKRTLIAIHGNYIWSKDEKGCATEENDGDWEVVETEKKPSQKITERLTEKLGERASSSMSNLDAVAWQGLHIAVILDFLDEHADVFRKKS